MADYIVLDVGGTQLRAARFPENSSTPTDIKKTSTQASSGQSLERLQELIASIMPTSGSVASITVAVPGPVDPFAGVILETPNIPGWVNLPLKNILEMRFQVPVILGNDANLAALAEWKYGAGRGHHHLVYITVSTGIGAGVIVDDRLLLGQRGLAGELGHTTVDPNGPPCGCGQRGHLETFAAGPAIARWAEEKVRSGIPSSLPANRPLTAKDVSQAAAQGDELAKLALSHAAGYLGRAVADFLHILNPTMVIFGGGVSQSGELYLGPMKEAMRNYVMSPGYLDNLTIATAALGDNVGLMGALALAHTLKAS